MLLSLFDSRRYHNTGAYDIITAADVRSHCDDSIHSSSKLSRCG
jgi:hypothetical protein